MQLIAKTSSAVAVSDELTTILDWTNIEDFSGFTIIIENKGGGSADSITDIQIDTSNDGGATSSLDQHDGVPVVPIPAGVGLTGTFTETAKYIRIRGLCAEGDETTVNCLLLADSAAARICLLSDVKDRLGESKTDYDCLINQIIAGLASVFDNETNRTLLLNATDATEYYTGQGNYIQLRRYPVVSITSIKEAIDYDFDSVEALLADSDYRIIGGGIKGIINRILLNWPETPDSIQVLYKGGFCAAGVMPAAGQFELPADLREAAIEQASFIFKRRNDIGLSGVSVMGGSMSKFQDIELLPMVNSILEKYKRNIL